jgi:hypothetical protein
MTIIIEQACVGSSRTSAWPVYAMTVALLLGLLSAVGAL